MSGRPVLVLGAHRSGTSVVARLVNLVGVHLGHTGRLLPPTQFNERGYWELRSVVELDEEVLACFGGSWREPPELADGWQYARVLDERRRRARAIVADELATDGLWGFKDPRACLTAPFWETVVGEPAYVLSVRNPLDAARSLERRDGIPDADVLWLRYVAAMLANTRRRRRIVIAYESVLDDPVAELRRLARFLGGRADVGYEEARAAREFVSTELWHHRPSATPESGTTDSLQTLYRALVAVRGDGDETLDRLAAEAEELLRPQPEAAPAPSRARSEPKPKTAPTHRRTGIRCSIVIPVRDHSDLTRNCLDAVLPVPDDVEVIVVDDGSTDDTRALLASYEDRIRVVRHERSGGFASACNDGAARAAGAYLVFLNNDTIPTDGWLETLCAYADEHRGAAVVGAKLLYPNGTVQHAGVAICSDGSPRHIYAGFPADHPAVSRSRRFQIVTAACALFRRGPFVAAGGFDTAYVNGHEDVDLCLRLGELGHEVHYCAASVVYHLESASRDREDSANHALYRRRWGSRITPDEFRYYVDDGLAELDYSSGLPPRIRLAEPPGKQREEDAVVVAEPATPEPAYDDLVARIQELVPQVLPRDADVLVISRGDERLVRLDGLRAGHFPQDEEEQYAGWYPATGADALAALERLSARYLVVPSPSRWWLDHYGELRAFLEARGEPVLDDPSCTVYALGAPVATSSVDRASYAGVIDQIRRIVDALVPAGAGVAVAAKGDDELLRHADRAAVHVPRDESGGYAGYHPATGGDAVAELERACADGYRYFVLPEPISWWLDDYPELRDALERRWTLIADRPGVCRIYDLGEPANLRAQDAPSAYASLIHAVRGTVAAVAEPGATVAIVSKGDAEFLAVPRRTLRHFPATADGGYAGYYPADAAQAVAWLERERDRGVAYIAFPATAAWWLDSYPQLAETLTRDYRLVWRDERCTLFDIRRDTPSRRGNRLAGVLLARARRQARVATERNRQ